MDLGALLARVAPGGEGRVVGGAGGLLAARLWREWAGLLGRGWGLLLGTYEGGGGGGGYDNKVVMKT